MDNNLVLQGLSPENYTAIYARHSNGDEKNNSNEYQISQCKVIAAELNLVVYKAYEDEGSGFSQPPENRNGFKQLLIDAKAGYFKNLIIWKIDRLWRQAYDYPKTKKLLESYGVKLIFSDMLQLEGMPPIYKSFMTNMLISVAELEPNRIREKTTKGKNFKRGKGIAFLNPISNFGYDCTNDKDIIYKRVTNPEIANLTEHYYIKVPLEAVFINACFKMYKNIPGNYRDRIKRIMETMKLLGELLKDVTLNNYKGTVDGIPDEKELKVIKNELITLKKSSLPKTSDRLKKDIQYCCSHCSNDSLLQYMLENPHFSGINTINIEDNENLLIYDEENLCFNINEKVSVNIVNIDVIVDKDLWFEVASHISTHKGNKPVKEINRYSFKVKCGKCNLNMEYNKDIYKCSKCGSQAHVLDIKKNVIKQLCTDEFLKSVIAKAEAHNAALDKDIHILEKDIEIFEKKCAKYALEYISKPSTDRAKSIKYIVNETNLRKDKLADLQYKKDAYLKYITKILFKSDTGWENLTEKLTRFFVDQTYEIDMFLNNIIKGVIIKDGKLQNKYTEIQD